MNTETKEVVVPKKLYASYEMVIFWLIVSIAIGYFAKVGITNFSLGYIFWFLSLIYMAEAFGNWMDALRDKREIKKLSLINQAVISVVDKHIVELEYVRNKIMAGTALEDILAVHVKVNPDVFNSTAVLIEHIPQTSYIKHLQPTE